MTRLTLMTIAMVVYATFAQAETHMVDVTAGDVTVSQAFARATLPNAPVAGGFVTIMNTGTADDRLVSAASAVSGMTQIHEMMMENDVMKMRQLPDGLIIPAGETVTLMPGGYHMMFMDLNGPLVEGDTITVRLTFEVAGEIDVQMPVGAPNQKMIDHADMTSGAMPAEQE